MSATESNSLAARSLDFTDIPVIDIGALRGDDGAAVARIADEIGRACREVGFLYVRNHGVPRAICERVVNASERFFALPEAVKMRYDIGAVQRHRGFVPQGGLYADPSKRPDVQEGYEVGLEVPADDPLCLAGNLMYHPNLWPAEVEGFRTDVYAYFEAVMALGRLMCRAFALHFELAPGWFEDKVGHPMGQLRLIHYPPQEGEISADRIGIGAHTDYEMFTMLMQTEHGLQVMSRAGEWVEAPPIEDTFVINIGDMLMRWSNGRFRSTPHRVINRSGRARYSFPFFFASDYDVVVRCLPTCVDADDPPRFPPTVAGRWTERNITDAYEYRRAVRGRVPDPELAG